MTSSIPSLAQTATTPFAKDVLAGLSDHPKRLPSKYFYDKRGDKLFQEIMQMPEYYLTDCEYEILEKHHSDLLQHFNTPFHLLELGAGDGFKTKVLLQHFLEEQADFDYLPIDISQNVLDELEADLDKRWPELNVQSQQGDYFEVLKSLSKYDTIPKVVLFLGSNIGNFEREDALRFLKELKASLRSGDQLLIGIDLKKDPEVIIQAYDDPTGITAAFNLNLLRRINRELDADFQLDQFRHWETYNPQTGATRSYLISQQAQNICINALNQSFHFEAWESINVELSQKYSVSEIEVLAQKAEFKVVKHFFDNRNYFVDSLWQVQ